MGWVCSDDGAGVLRRSANIETVAIFGQADVESGLSKQADPGSLFEDKRRHVHDNALRGRFNRLPQATGSFESRSLD